MADSIRALEEAARLEPSSGTIRRSLGDARAKAGAAAGARADWKASVDLSRGALRVNPGDVRQLKNVAVCLAKLGRGDEALRAAQEALQAGPASVDGHYGAAVVHTLLGHAKEALAHLEKAIELGASASLVLQDDDLAPLRATPEFSSVVERARKARIKEVRHES